MIGKEYYKNNCPVCDFYSDSVYATRGHLYAKSKVDSMHKKAYEKILKKNKKV